MRQSNRNPRARTLRRLAAGLVAFAFVAAACGGDDGGTSTPATAAPQTTASGGSDDGGDDGGDDDGDGGSETTAAPAPAPDEASVDTIRIGVASLQEQFVDPHFAVGGLLFPMRWAISEPLYRQTLDLEWVPNLATGYEISDDGLTWTFTLRDDVMMHDGSQFTARDVKTAVDRVLGSDDFSHVAVFRAAVTGAEVIDDYTVAVTSAEPFSTMLGELPVPIPTDYYNEVGEEGFRERPMAAGAWKFVEQELNASITYERFDDFFDDDRKPNFRNLIYEIIPDESSRLAGIRTGAIDMAFGLTALSAQQLETEPNVRIVQSEATGQAWIFPLDQLFPDEPSALLDERVRRALLMAVDREAIAESLYLGYAQVPKSNAPPTMLGYEQTLDVAYDPDGAKALLEEAGATGLTLTLNSYNSTPTVPDVVKLAETIAAYWTQAGIDVELNVADGTSILPAWRERQLRGTGLLAGPSQFYDEPARLMSSFFLSNASYSTIADDGLDELGDRISNELDIDARTVLGNELNETLNEGLYALPIVLLNSLIAVGPNVANFEPMLGSPYPGPVWSLQAN